MRPTLGGGGVSCRRVLSERFINQALNHQFTALTLTPTTTLLTKTTPSSWTCPTCSHLLPRITTRSSSSNSQWKSRQTRDRYAQAAKVQGLKSRAAFKLLEVHPPPPRPLSFPFARLILPIVFFFVLFFSFFFKSVSYLYCCCACCSVKPLAASPVSSLTKYIIIIIIIIIHTHTHTHTYMHFYLHSTLSPLHPFLNRWTQNTASSRETRPSSTWVTPQVPGHRSPSSGRAPMVSLWAST